MRISMWILAGWLEQYDPVIKIRQGERVLQNARLFSDELRMSRSTVYLDQIQSDRVLCSNGHDYLVLHAEDVNEVFNAVLDAFDYYNEWSGDAYDLIDRGCELREILDFGARLLRRVVILADAGFYMREVAGPGEVLRAFPTSWNALEDRMLPHEALLEISKLPHIRVPEKPTYRIDPPGVRPGAAVTNLFAGPVHKGWLITVNADGEYPRGTLDLQDAFCEILSVWMEKNERYDQRLERSGVFLELLENPDEAKARARAEDRLQTFGWYPPDRKQLYTLRQTDPALDPMHAVERYLERLNPYAFLVRFDDALLYIVNHQLSPPEQYEDALRDILARCGCVAGRSRIFTELSSLPEQYQLSRIAARFAPDAPGGVRGFEDAALPYLSGVLKDGSAVDPRHPALAVLAEYDAAHDARLGETLDVFLRHNCSYADAAAALFIHRSTLLYRLNRIRELTGVDLEDYDARLHLQISFLLGL